FLSTNGNWRWQFWRSAWHEFSGSPLVGRGAGSFQWWWSQNGISVGYVGNPHSLYMEALGELGLVRFLLLVGALLVGTAAGAQAALRSTGARRDAAAAALAGFVAFAVASGVDWMWELPGVAVVGMSLLGLSLTSEQPERSTRKTRRRR